MTLTPLKTPITADVAKAHIDQHSVFLTDVEGALPLGKGAASRSEFPRNPGVYCVFEDGDLIYVGETGDLNERMRDLLDTRSHTLRRSLGKAKFGDHPAYQPASPSVKFPQEIESLLTQFMLEHLKVKAAPVILGRKEIEEKLIEDKKPKYNTRERRGEVVEESGS